MNNNLEKFYKWCEENKLIDMGYDSKKIYFITADNNFFEPKKYHIVGLFREYVITHSWWNRKESEELIENNMRKDLMIKYLKKVLLFTEINDCFEAFKQIIGIFDGYQELPDFMKKEKEEDEISMR